MRIHVSSQHTTESDIHTPWQSPLQCFCSLFDCGSFESPKTKRDNAFSICSAPPSGSAHLSEHPSHYGQIAFAKVQRKKEIMKEKVAKKY